MPRGRDVTVQPEPAVGEARVLANRYRIERKLGAGNFGTAFLCKDLKVDGELKVLKEIMCGDLAPDETVDAVHEAKLLSKLNHVNIVRFHDSFLDGSYFCIVTEFCEGGDLEDRMTKYRKSGRRFDESTVLNWFVQLVMAVKHMHSRRVLHRDLKARNIFLSKDDTVKVGDFGISRMLMGTTDMASTFVGTPYYMSPEALKHEGYNSKSDIWSVGCLLYELCELKHAFEGQGLMGVMYRIVEGNCPEISSRYSKEINSLLKRLLDKDPDKRAGSTEILQNEFVRSHIARYQTQLSCQNEAPDNTIIATSDAKVISQELSRKWYKEDLQDEEVKRNVGLTPVELMKRRKQAKADERARQLQEKAREQQEENRTIRTVRKSMDNMTTHQLRNVEVEAARLHDLEHTLIRADPPARPKTAPDATLLAALEEDESDEEEGTLRETQRYNLRETHAGYTTIAGSDHRTMMGSKPSSTQRASQSLRPSSAVQDWSGMSYDRVFNTSRGQPNIIPDERPITPLQDPMVYNKDHSSLDFEEGVPTDAVVADTYYYDDGEFGDDQPQYVQVVHTSAPDAEDTQYELIDALHGAMQFSEADNTLTFGDIAGGDAFGPAAKMEKIKKMKAECSRKLGAKTFRAAYDFLKRARFGPNPMEEADIMQELRKIAPNTSDCFLVEQLIFLELAAGQS